MGATTITSMAFPVTLKVAFGDCGFQVDIPSVSRSSLAEVITPE